MEVTRNLRVPKVDRSRMRMIRVVGDGTPENTKILDQSGEPIPELVTSYSIQGDTEGCARGVFIYLETDENGELVVDQQTGEFLEDTFEAFVVLERPPELSKAEPLKSQIARLAQFIVREVPDKSSENEGAVDTAIRLLRQLVPVPREGERYWSCKIGPVADDELSGSDDAPMRALVQGAFKGLFGRYASETTSGWGAHLTQGERRAAESFQDGTPREGGTKEFGDSGTAVQEPEIDLDKRSATQADRLVQAILEVPGDQIELVVDTLLRYLKGRAASKIRRIAGRDGGTKEGLEDGGIGTPCGPELEKASDAPAECFAEPRESTETLRAGTDESGEAAFSRLAPGGDGCGESR